MKYLFIFLIKIYQVCFKPFTGQCCKYYPSCSNYAHEAILKHGAIYGSWLSLKRILRCNPWHSGGGEDPVP
ncbi:MAG: membrane protein insertion efficiency factor YidD [Waddliaceae bacterium]